ncbi:MAG: putative Ig domain-containing protein, partial [Magnetococcales bacterium]|nr:putative Ig domain-containing protein [Magnetococcales bacterium]
PINDAPTGTTTLIDQKGDEEAAFTYQIPSTAFADVDIASDGDLLTYSATQVNGSALPAWLNFDTATHTFSGTPSVGNAGLLNIKVTATDSALSTASLTFKITIDAKVIVPPSPSGPSGPAPSTPPVSGPAPVTATPPAAPVAPAAPAPAPIAAIAAPAPAANTGGGNDAPTATETNTPQQTKEDPTATQRDETQFNEPDDLNAAPTDGFSSAQSFAKPPEGFSGRTGTAVEMPDGFEGRANSRVEADGLNETSQESEKIKTDGFAEQIDEEADYNLEDLELQQQQQLEEEEAAAQTNPEGESPLDDRIEGDGQNGEDAQRQGERVAGDNAEPAPPTDENGRPKLTTQIRTAQEGGFHNSYMTMLKSMIEQQNSTATQQGPGTDETVPPQQEATNTPEAPAEPATATP